jgi:hypothetical protein
MAKKTLKEMKAAMNAARQDYRAAEKFAGKMYISYAKASLAYSRAYVGAEDAKRAKNAGYSG